MPTLTRGGQWAHMLTNILSHTNTLFQWFILVITICFVVSNGGERINKKRSFNLDPGAKKRKRDIDEPEKLSTRVRFPLWVSISGFGNVGVNTRFTKVGDNLYEFTLPFLVEVKESDVLVNRSAKQDKNLAFPFFVRVTHAGDNKNKYANETTLDKVRLAFPFELEVARMSFAASVSRGLSVEPQARSIILLAGLSIAGIASSVVGAIALAGSIAIGGTIAVAGSIVATVIAAVVITVIVLVTIHVVRAAAIAVYYAAVELLRPHDHTDGYVEKPRNIIGGIVGGIVGAIVSFLPGLENVVKAGITHVFQTFGDSVGIFVNEIFSFGIFGDFVRLVQLGINIFISLPFMPWRLIPVRGDNPSSPPDEQRPAPLGQFRPPPTIIVPQFPILPVTEQQAPFVIRIYYGQMEIPGFPAYIIVWPGRPEPPITDLIILRPIIPTLPKRPNVRLVWPIQSHTPLRPNIILIQPGQVFILGYVNIIIVWPGQPEPYDSDITIIRPNEETIPNIVGVRLVWPGQTLNQPLVIILQPGQRQHPQYPTIIFQYPGDPPPPKVPGLTIVSPPLVNLPDYPSISIIWPNAPMPPNLQPLFVSPDDVQLQQLPNVFIKQPGQTQIPSQPGITYISPGQAEVPGYPGVPLKWLPPNKTPQQMPITNVYILPNATTVPGHPDCRISRPGRPSPNTPQSVNFGDRTLPNNPNVMLTWLEMPTELVLKASPDIYNVQIERTNTMIERSPAQLFDIDKGLTSEREVLQISKTNLLLEKDYNPPRSTFDTEDHDVQLRRYGSEPSKRLMPVFGVVCC